jgi:hypothetical protein
MDVTIIGMLISVNWIGAIYLDSSSSDCTIFLLNL